MRLCLGRLFYTLKGYGVEFIHPEACLVVLVAGQRSQASLSARGAVNVLTLGRQSANFIFIITTLSLV